MLYTTTRAKDAAASGIQSDWLGMGANIAGGLGKTGWYLRDKIDMLKNGLDTDAWLKKNPGKKLPAPTPTFIIDVMQIIVGALDASMGLWAPERGTELATGSALFGSVNKSLQLASKIEGIWSGSSADKYAERNKILEDLANELRELDKKTKAVLESQADTVQQAHTKFQLLLMSLVFAQLTAMLIWAAGPSGPAASVTYQQAFVLGCVPVVMLVLTNTFDNSRVNALKLQSLTSNYNGVAEKAKSSGAFTTISVAEAEKSTVSSFADISATLSEASDMPEFAALLNVARANPWAGVNPVLGAFPAGDETAGNDTHVPDTSTVPTLAQLTAMSAQAAKISGQLSQPMNMFTQTIGQLQQMASTAQQDRGPATSAEKPAAEEAKAAPEGAGTDAAERAPISEQAQPAAHDRANRAIPLA